MMPSSLKKMSGSKEGQEGNYASLNTLKQNRSIKNDLGLTLLTGLQTQQNEKESHSAAAICAVNVQKHGSNRAISTLLEVSKTDMQTSHIASAVQEAIDPKSGTTCSPCRPTNRESISREKGNDLDGSLQGQHYLESQDGVQSVAVLPKAPRMLILDKIEDQSTAKDIDGGRSERPKYIKKVKKAERIPGVSTKPEGICRSDYAVEQTTRRHVRSITSDDSDEGLLGNCLQRDCPERSVVHTFGRSLGDQEAEEQSIGDLCEESAVRDAPSRRSGPDDCVIAACSSFTRVNYPTCHERRSQTVPVASTLADAHQSLDAAAMVPNSRLCVDSGPGIKIKINSSLTCRRILQPTKKGLRSWTGHYPSNSQAGTKTYRASHNSHCEDIKFFSNSFGKHRQPLSFIYKSSSSIHTSSACPSKHSIYYTIEKISHSRLLQDAVRLGRDSDQVLGRLKLKKPSHQKPSGLPSTETRLSRRRAVSLPNARSAYWGSIMTFPKDHAPPEQHYHGWLTPPPERSQSQADASFLDSFLPRESASVQPGLAGPGASAFDPSCLQSRSSHHQQPSITLSNDYRNNINIWGINNAPVAINDHTGTVQQALHNLHSMNTISNQNPMVPPTFYHQVQGESARDMITATEFDPAMASLKHHYDHLYNENSLLHRDREYLLNQNRNIMRKQEGQFAYHAQLKRQNAKMALKCEQLEKRLSTADRDLAQKKKELTKVKDSERSLRIENAKLHLMNIEITEKLSKITAGTRSNQKLAQDILRSPSSLGPIVFNNRSSHSTQYEAKDRVARRPTAIAADLDPQLAYPDATLRLPSNTVATRSTGEFQSSAGHAWDSSQAMFAAAPGQHSSELSDRHVTQTANPSQLIRFTGAQHFTENNDSATINPQLISYDGFTLPNTSASPEKVIIDLTNNESIPALPPSGQSSLSVPSEGDLQTQTNQKASTTSPKGREVSWLIGYHPGMTQAENTRRMQTMKDAQTKRKYVEPHPESVAPEPGASPTKKAKKTPLTKARRASPTASLTAREPSTPTKAKRSTPMTRAETTTRQKITAERYRLKKKYEKDLEKKFPRDSDEFKAAMRKYGEAHKVRWGSLKAAAMSPEANGTQDGTVVADRSTDITVFSDPHSFSGSNDSFADEDYSDRSNESSIACDPATAGTSVSPMADPGLDEPTEEDMLWRWFRQEQEEEEESLKRQSVETEAALQEESEESEEE